VSASNWVLFTTSLTTLLLLEALLAGVSGGESSLVLLRHIIYGDSFNIKEKKKKKMKSKKRIFSGV
jgi:hypothetical protein